MPRIGFIRSIESRKKQSKSIRGENHYRAKLNSKEVKEIRKKHDKKQIPMKLLSMEYNISYQAVYKIIKRYTWKDIA